ncbi:MAG: C4-dicarboxylate ABC transporter [Rhodococcus sp. (in: high G+C Gram-positive bacteria)]|uniref:TDT family transporter n=1 Tax=Rhodococcus sp. TaxID=1831 RepID=UPI0011F8FF82|nr:TDT family transporter [Rhodococcus sp. (in: high G+C Gram-positive bacteria)]RZL22498.1 MAG: C4-dicarboxylate ABC transporter [Rhodococcus sp. (in: high G+C Gram-positive bacteria)]
MSTATPSAFAHITPNWFAAAMGTGIVSVAAASLQHEVAALHVVADLFWFLAAAILIALIGAFTAHWITHRDLALAYLRSPAMFPFYGAVAMALVTVGSATGVTGANYLGHSAAVTISITLWVLGTTLGLCTYVVMMVRLVRDAGMATAMPFWLMPVVPPMVSATTGAAVTTHLTEGAVRTSVLVFCYVMFALALSAALIIATAVARQFADNRARGVDAIPFNAIPSLWIPLGVIGQSIGAANLLADAARHAVAADTADALHTFGLVYGTVVGALGVVAFIAVTTVTIRALRGGLSFSLGWWSFTFPIGACAVGANAFGIATGSQLILAVAAALLLALIPIWATVAARTVNSIRSGALPAPA